MAQAQTNQTQGAVLTLRQPEKTPESLSLTQLALRRLRKDRLTLLALGILITLTLSSLFAPLIADALDVSYTATNARNTFAPMFSEGHLFGTDDLGRDFFIRLLYAGQVSLGIAVFAALLSLGIGVSLGITTGYYGGLIDDLVNWLIATLSSIPSIFLLLIVSAAVLRNEALANSPIAGPLGMVLIFGLLGWTSTTRLVRGETLALREREYVVSARALGASSTRIMFTHILPNLFSVVVINLAIDIGSLILAESGLSFLGLGVRPPTPTWGNLLTESQTYFNRGLHLVVIPGLLISLTVLCLYVIGDGLRDSFDPTTVD